MLKLIIDDLTGKINGYTNVRDNTCIYKDSVLVQESKLQDIDLSKAFWVDGGIVEKETEKTELTRLEEQIAQKQQAIENKTLLDYMLDGHTFLEITKLVSTGKSELEKLVSQRKTLIEERKKEQTDYYLKMNREADAKLACRYYSAVILLIKDENRYLAEWLDWHLNLGFDHIYIYDNGNKEDVQDIVSTYPEENRGKITAIDWRGHHTHIQQDAYNHFLNNYGQDVRWGLFIDSDEFLRFTDEESTTVNDFLRDYEDYTEIWGYEVEYDANGQEIYENKPVRERFTRRTNVREGFYHKNFIQVNRIDRMIMHYAFYDPDKHMLFENEKGNQDLFAIDHYYTKSWEEWQEKIKVRGGADPNYHKALREFFIYNPDMVYLDTGEQAYQKYEGM